jgi:prophage regulatory protein
MFFKTAPVPDSELPALPESELGFLRACRRVHEILTKNGAKPVRLISREEVVARVGLTYPTIWKWMRAGKFPRSRQNGGRSSWVESEVDLYIVTRPVKPLKGD